MKQQLSRTLLSTLAWSLCTMTACSSKPKPAHSRSQAAPSKTQGMDSMGVTFYDKSGHKTGDYTVRKDSVTGTAYDKGGGSRTATGTTTGEVFDKLGKSGN